MQVDLRDQIENHCDNCSQNGIGCNGCFFASVDMGTETLGGIEIYGRAFKYLKNSPLNKLRLGGASPVLTRKVYV